MWKLDVEAAPSFQPVNVGAGQHPVGKSGSDSVNTSKFDGRLGELAPVIFYTVIIIHAARTAI
jgi:hypothetical protein